MRKVLWSAAATGGLTLALALAACKAPDGAETGRGAAAAPTAPTAAATPGVNVRQPVQAPQTDAIVRRVTPAEAQEMAQRGEAVLVDVRTKEQYDASHIRGAISLPRGEAAARAAELPKDKLLIFYCA